MAEALDGAVVEVPLRHVEVALRYRIRVDLELVVLARDMDAAGVEVFDRMVRAVMPVGEPRGRRPRRAPKDLVTEADAEERQPAERVARQLDRSVKHSRVAGPV